MKKRGLIILAAVLIVICFLNILIRGKTLTVSIELYRSEGKTAADYTVDLEAGSEIAEIIKTELSSIGSLKRGRKSKLSEYYFGEKT